MPQKSIIQLLQNYKKNAREKYHQYGLHIRVRDVTTIENKNERTHEKLRHSRVAHDIKYLNEDVRSTLKKVSNSDELLDIYNTVDIHQENRTPANILEERLKNIDSITKLIEDNPERYTSDILPVNRDVRYSKATGLLQQGTHSFIVKDDAKKLIDYLWGKRLTNFHDGSPGKSGRLVSTRSIIANCNIIEGKLPNIIDNFNQQTKKETHPIEAFIRRKDGLIQLETSNEHPTSK